VGRAARRIITPAFVERTTVVKGEGSMSKRRTTPHKAAKPGTLPLASRKLVVADDEPDQVDFLATVFEDNGATVVRATNGDEALEMVRNEKPDLLTLDLAMPGKNVGEVFEALRKDPDCSDLKICVITGRPELRKLIYERSVRPPEGYLDKPVTEEKLLLVVREIMRVPHKA
jgi:twitching motility two-component system response regulator PilH